MKSISLDNFGPIISNKEHGEEIYHLLTTALEKDSRIEIDLKNINSMATFCAKQIFGRLYIEMGSSFFFDKIMLKNANNDLKVIIRIGINDALEESKGKTRL